MQSGIIASKELHDAFNALVASTSQRALLVGIEAEQLVPTLRLGSTSSNFLEDLSILDSALKDNEATYILLRRYDGILDGCVAVTYIPDTASVRSKMLFASTRLTLLRELGVERFRKSVFATTKADLGREGWERHERNEGVEAPLTDQESSLVGIRKAEAELGRGTTGRNSHVSSGLNFAVSSAAMEALRELGISDHNLVQLRIDAKKECVELAGTSTTAVEGVAAAVSSIEPRYSFYRHVHDYDGERQRPIIFIYTCPASSTIKERMLYASSRAGILSTAVEEAGLEIVKKLEASSPLEISASMIDEQLQPRLEQKQPFSRPRRPGRR